MNKGTHVAMIFLGGVGLGCFQAGAAEEPMPNLPRRLERTQPDDTALQITSQRQQELDAVEREIREKRRALEAGRTTTESSISNLSTSSSGPGPSSPSEEKELEPLDSSGPTSLLTPLKEGKSTSQASKGLPRRKSVLPPSGSRFGGGFRPLGGGTGGRSLGSPLQVFKVSQDSSTKEGGTLTVLPTGSHVKARVVSGVEANSREPYPVLLQLDYAFTGPNSSVIDLSHCFMIAKARANLSTERVIMETENLSCVRENGEHFKREAKGFVAGNDNTFGATGTYISKQSQVLLAAVLASVAKNAGQAIADVQKTTSVLGADKAAAANNITGSKAAFVAGSALIDGGAMVAQWYLEQAKELLPSIGVGSGQDVFVVMLDSVSVPRIQVED